MKYYTTMFHHEPMYGSIILQHYTVECGTRVIGSLPECSSEYSSDEQARQAGVGTEDVHEKIRT